jgi:ribosomal protein S18 acetylase RimI-like enzyme
MRVRSLGLHTDLALAGWRGAVRDRHDHLIVTHPGAPAFRGGNLVVFDRPPDAGDLERWCALFDAAIPTPPDRPYRSIAWDGVDGEEGAVSTFVAAGFERHPTVVLAADRLLPPEHPRTDLRIAPVESDADWRAAVRVQGADAEPERRARYEAAVGDVMRLNRRAVDAGHGVWWGAFDGERMVATLGLFRVDDMARYQAVVTVPAERGRGAAATLLHHAAEVARAAWGTELFVLEADADGPALGLYRRLGLDASEHRTALTQDLSTAP